MSVKRRKRKRANPLVAAVVKRRRQKMSQSMNDTLKAIYYDSRHPAGFSSVKKLSKASGFFYKQVKKLRDIDSIHTSIMNVENNFICNKCSKPEKLYYCKYCKKPFKVKDSRWKHQKVCKSNPNPTPKTKESKSTQKL